MWRPRSKVFLAICRFVLECVPSLQRRWKQVTDSLIFLSSSWETLHVLPVAPWIQVAVAACPFRAPTSYSCSRIRPLSHSSLHSTTLRLSLPRRTTCSKVCNSLNSVRPDRRRRPQYLGKGATGGHDVSGMQMGKCLATHPIHVPTAQLPDCLLSPTASVDTTPASLRMDKPVVERLTPCSARCLRQTATALILRCEPL